MKKALIKTLKIGALCLGVLVGGLYSYGYYVDNYKGVIYKPVSIALECWNTSDRSDSVIFELSDKSTNFYPSNKKDYVYKNKTAQVRAIGGGVYFKIEGFKTNKNHYVTGSYSVKRDNRGASDYRIAVIFETTDQLGLSKTSSSFYDECVEVEV